MINVLILLAGGSDAFQKAGHVYPKALIEVAGEPMINRVIGTLQPLIARKAQLIFAIRKEDNRAFHLGDVIRLLAPDSKIVETPSETAGAACSALLAIEYINIPDPLIIINGDQLLEVDLGVVLDDFKSRTLDGGIAVFRSVHPRWSFAKTDKEGTVIETAEKKPISHHATAGFYYYARGADFVAAACDMIRKGDSHNGAYFICPAYNQIILKGSRIGIYEIPATHYHSLASPALLENYEMLIRTRTIQ